MVNSKKLSATMTTDHTTHPLARTSKSLVFDTAIFTPSNGHLYLIQRPSSGSAQGADIQKVHGYPLVPYFPHSIPGLLQGQVYSKSKFTLEHIFPMPPKTTKNSTAKPDPNRVWTRAHNADMHPGTLAKDALRVQNPPQDLDIIEKEKMEKISKKEDC